MRTTIAAMIGIVLLAACGGGAVADPTVTQRTFRFRPATVRVDAGSKVTWVNEDPVDHTLTAGTPRNPTNAFDQPLGKKGIVVIAFPTAGTFDYFCSIHTSMRGEIVVT
ncbi:MAG TPA: plastocyanin/azurin family copper-binding protein [Actinomycetota bacterium]|nr:plastocyanin/azurin family copper-binding protein [Actinomycetota bacterium]